MTQFGMHPKTLSGKTTVECANIVASMPHNVPIHFPTNQLPVYYFHSTTLLESVFGVSMVDPFLNSLTV